MSDTRKRRWKDTHLTTHCERPSIVAALSSARPVLDDSSSSKAVSRRHRSAQHFGELQTVAMSSIVASLLESEGAWVDAAWQVVIIRSAMTETVSGEENTAQDEPETADCLA